MGIVRMVEEALVVAVDVPWVESVYSEVAAVEPPCRDDDASCDAEDAEVVFDDDGDDGELALAAVPVAVRRQTIDEVCLLDSMDFVLPIISPQHFRVFRP